MEGVLQVEMHATKRKRRSIDYSLCILCQKNQQEALVAESKSATKLFEALTKRSQYEDTEFEYVEELLNDVDGLRKQNGRWHLSCYKRCTHKTQLGRLEARYKKRQDSIEIVCEPTTSNTTMPYTRSCGGQVEKNTCFFCDQPESRRHKLFTVATCSAGAKLNEAVNQCENEHWKVKLSGCIDPNDAHAYDISYHKECYTKNVVNVLRKTHQDENMDTAARVVDCACKVDFIHSLSGALQDGKVVSIAEAEDVYKQICVENGMENDDIMKRKALKTFIEEEFWDKNLQFLNPIQKNQPQRMLLKSTANAVLSKLEEASSLSGNMKTLFEAASIIRKCILSTKQWHFQGSVDVDEHDKVVPGELEIFFKWCIAGGNRFKNHKIDTEQVARKASILSQNLMYECLSERQVKKGKTTTSKKTRDYPLQVGVGLTVHANTRSKFLVQLMHSLGCSIEYSKVLRLETSIAEEVMRRMDGYGGVYIPPEFVTGRFMYCAVDNIDFLEDTPDGKGTLHGTVMVCYQECLSEDQSGHTVVPGPATSRSLKVLPKYMTCMMEYKGPKNIKPPNQTFTKEIVHSDKADLSYCASIDMAWLLSKCLKRSSEHATYPTLQIESQETSESQNSETVLPESQPKETSYIPTWSAFNSAFLEQPGSIARLCVLPIIPASPTDHSVQLTFLTQLELVTKHVCGNNSKCVLTLDLGLYKPVQQLIMSRSDLHNRWIVRPGELHICFAMIRAIGVFIDGTGIPDLWTALYGDNTVSQIIAGKKFRRALEAHTRTLVALQDCYFQYFFESHVNLYDGIYEKVQELKAKFNGASAQGHLNELLRTIKECDLLNQMKTFDEREEKRKPTFRMLRTYIRMLECLLQFLRSVRSGNWDVHLSSLADFVKYLFALDLTNYSGMIAWYIADMRSLKESDRGIWDEFERGNWVVNKSKIPFCALACDEALEHQNRAMKVLGGLVGITQQPSALARFFLTAPELQKLSQELLNITGSSSKQEATYHHLNSERAANFQDTAISTLRDELERIGNPFKYEGPELINISTKAVFSDQITADVSSVESLGTELYETFKSDRLIDGAVSLWAPIKRNKLNLCSSNNKSTKVTISGSITELSADRNLFSRLLIVTRSQRELDLRTTLGKYEMSVVPRSMFALDGTMYQCAAKSKLIHILKSVVEQNTNNTSESLQFRQPNSWVAIVDGMGELQALNKTIAIKTCTNLADVFIEKIQKKYWQYDELHIVFDVYFENSIKNPTRVKRLCGGTAAQYKICDTTDISKIDMKKFLSHIRTKDELTNYLAHKIFSHAKKCSKKFVVSWRTEVSATHCSLECLKSSHEEADTKIVLHAINAKDRGAATLLVFAQDTDILVLLVRRYPKLPENTFFVPLSGELIAVQDIFNSLGALKASALPGFHAISGCDSTGTLHGKGKLSYWKSFVSASEKELLALQELGTSEYVSDDVINQLEAFICRVYQPRTTITSLAELRWSMFTNKQALGEKLPPTSGSFIPAVKRANFQALVWSQDNEAKPVIPNPVGHGWSIEAGVLAPVMCEEPCAPEALLKLIKCSCMKNRCSPPCKCLANNMPCTEMCVCNGDETICDNLYPPDYIDEDSDTTDETDL